MKPPSHLSRHLLLATALMSATLGGAMVSQTAAAARLELPPPAAGSRSLDFLWQRPTSSSGQAVDVRGSTPPTVGIAASGRSGFGAKLAASLRSRSQGSLSALPVGQVGRTIGTLRRASPRLRRDLSRLGDQERQVVLNWLSASPDLALSWDGPQLVFVTGSNLAGGPQALPAAPSSPEAAAARFWTAAAPLLQLEDPTAELRLVRRQTDALGQVHLRYEQIFEGHPVWARDAIVHLAPGGEVVAFNGRLVPTPVGLRGAVPRVEGTAAEEAAAAHSNGRSRQTAGAATGSARARAQALEIFVSADGMARLTWRVHVERDLADVRDVFVDALTGEVVHEVSRVAEDGPVTGSGVDLQGQTRSLDLYQLGSNFHQINAAKPMFDAAQSSIPQNVKGGIRIFDAQHGDGQQLFFSMSNSANNWAGKAADVSAAANASLVYDYYQTAHGRNSINGNGGTMELVVNFKSNLNNAFWNGQFMVFGNGDNSHFSDLAAALDVSAHEMTHGVIENTANLIYETQSGALNESFADVFGTCAEFYAKPGAANWLMGEEVTTPGIPGDALRNMQDPAAANVAFGAQQPTRMSEYRNLPNDDQNDHGGVHVNSGIPNRAFYLVANDPALGGTPAERIGKAERIYYRALANYLTRSAQFIDCRLAVIQAAGDLFGAGGAVATACAQAFDTVEITDGTPTEPPPTLPPVAGQEWMAATDASTGQLLRFDPTDLDPIEPITSVAVRNKATFTDDGSAFLFIDDTQRLRAANADGSGEIVVSGDPVWHSIAVSPDGNRLAATSTALDGRIYLLDLTGTGRDTVFAISSQNYGGEGDNPARFADFLDFSNDGRFVMYDAFNLKVQAGGDSLLWWDINLLRASDGNILRVFPPQETGVSIGNPTFSPISDFIIAFDFVGPQGEVATFGANLEQGTAAVLALNSILGRPSFAPDARRVALQFLANPTTPGIEVVSLAADGISPTGAPQPIATGGFDPLWFAIGTRSPVTLLALSAVREDAGARIAWEVTRDASFDHFRVLRDAGAGFEVVSPELREPQERTGNRETWEFRDPLAGLPPDVASLRYAVQAVSASGEMQILGNVDLKLDGAAGARVVRLLPNVPNPFNPSTAIRFTLGRRQQVDLGIFDVGGRRVRTLWREPIDAGAHVKIWDGRDEAGVALSSGVYFARLWTEDGMRTLKLALVR